MSSSFDGKENCLNLNSYLENARYDFNWFIQLGNFIVGKQKCLPRPI